MTPLPFRSSLARYRAQAAELLSRLEAGATDAVQVFHENHPRFLDETVRWKPKDMSPEEILTASLTQADAELAVARAYSFQDWASLEEWVRVSADEGSAAGRFEAAVEAVVAGDEAALARLLAQDPELVRARSGIVTSYDPPVHRATLLHYVAANGVEGFRQRTPPNALAIARQLLAAGCDPNAVAEMYGGEATVLSMLVSSSHPAQAGVQVELVRLLADFGADLEGRGKGDWVSPLRTALAFGYRAAAEALAERGARVKDLADAAGLGRLAESQRLLAGADGPTRHRALALAVQNGQLETVRLLLDASGDSGEDASRYNPEGCHSHATPLHQAVAGGDLELVKLLVASGARLEVKDLLWQSTPLGWAEHLEQKEIAEFLKPSTP